MKNMTLPWANRVRGPQAPQQAARNLAKIAMMATATGLSFQASDTHAAGFALREHGFEAAATSFAGSSAQTDSAAFLAYNPATSAGVQGWDAQVTLNAIYPTSDAIYSVTTTSLGTATGGNQRPGDFIQDAYEPGLALRLRLNEDWTAGLSVSAPFGLATKYGKAWAGRYYAVESRLLTVNIAPSLAWKASDSLTLSGGLQAQYAKGTLSNALDFGTIGAAAGVPGAVPGAQDGFVEFNADDWAFGYVLGALWQPTPALTVGGSWRSQLDHTLAGKVDFTLDAAGTGATLSTLSGAFTDTTGRANLALPAVGTIGVAWKATPELTLLAEAGYMQWSRFRELRLAFANPAQPDSFQTYDWKDTWLGAVGLRYEPTPGWTLRGGVAIDESPTRNSTRDPRIPDATRTWLSFGIERQLTDRASLQLGYARLIFPEEPVSLSATTPGNEVRGNLAGRTDADADMISFQVTFR